MTKKSLEINVKKKAKAFCTGERTIAMEASKLPCSACRRVGRNSILCIKCNSWALKRCSEIRNCLIKNLTCRKCSGFICSIEVDEKMTLDGDVTEKVAKFSHLGDVLSSGGVVQDDVTVRIRWRWKKFKDIPGVLC